MRFMEDIKPGYFAVIPANVRYSKEISNGAKLLYAEITCLSNQHGYCWASNTYFSKLYEVSIDTISRWISELARAEFIVTIVDNAAGNSRKIWLYETQGIGKKQDTLSAKMPKGYRQKTGYPIRKNADIIVKENSKNETTTKEKIDVAVFDPSVNALIVDSMPLEAKKENPSPVPPPPSQPAESLPRRWDAFDIDTEAAAMKEDYRVCEKFAIDLGNNLEIAKGMLPGFIDSFVSDQKTVGQTYNNRIEFRKHFFNLVRRKAEIARDKPTQTPSKNLTSNMRQL